MLSQVGKKMPSSIAKAVLASYLWFTVRGRKTSPHTHTSNCLPGQFLLLPETYIQWIRQYMEQIFPGYSRFAQEDCKNFFLRRKNPAPACNDPLLSEHLDFWDSQQYTGTCILPVLRTWRDNPYTTSGWIYDTHHITSFTYEIYNDFYFFLWECQVVSTALIYVPWMNGQLPETEYPAEWPEMPCPAFWKSPTGHTSWRLILPITVHLA